MYCSDLIYMDSFVVDVRAGIQQDKITYAVTPNDVL